MGVSGTTRGLLEIEKTMIDEFGVDDGLEEITPKKIKIDGDEEEEEIDGDDEDDDDEIVGAFSDDEE